MTLLNNFLDLAFLEWTYKFKNDHNCQENQFVIKTIFFETFLDRLKLLNVKIMARWLFKGFKHWQLSTHTCNTLFCVHLL